ncbi:MAG: glutamate racemase [Clostridia bacterium]
MDNRAIGVFDSGLGGLTAVKELRKILPNETILYFGDTGRVPYGTRSAEIIAKYTKQDMEFLLKQNVKAIVAACGTVSSNAIHVLKELPVPYTSVIEPSSYAAIHKSRNGKIGVIATSATINSGAFEKKLKEINPDVDVFSTACPLLVSLVENGFIDENETITNLALEKYLTPFISKDIDTLILGCTHYPILKNSIAKIMGPKVALVSSGEEIAKSCMNILAENDLLSNNKMNEDEFFVSDSVQDFNDIAKICLGQEITEKITKIDIEKS